MKPIAEEMVSMKTIDNTRKKSVVVLFAGLLIWTAFVSIVGNWNYASDDGHELNADLPPAEPKSPAITTRSVLVELFTGTWCQWCPGAEGALDRLAEVYPRTALSILEYHYNDPYEVPGNYPERAVNYYGVGSWPTAIFDGIDVRTGGAQVPNDPSIDTDYMMRIDSRLPIPTEVAITLNGTLDMGTGVINANISALDTIPPMLTNLKARFAVYEDHNYTVKGGIGGNQDFPLRFTVVENLPEEAITLTKAQSLEFTKPFTLDPAWDLNKLGAVVFVQADNTHEVIASASYNLSAAAMKSDLAISPEDISFSNPNPTDGEVVTIYATVHNAATWDVTVPTAVRFYDGDPFAGGTQIGTDQDAGVVLAGNTATVQVNWDTTGMAGTHEICVVADATGIIDEYENENNNKAPKMIDVQPSAAPPYATFWNPTGLSEPVNTDFDVQWTKVMNWNAVNSSFSYTDSITTWLESDGVFTHDPFARTSTFNPNVDLAPGTTYTVTFDTTATDLGGSPLDQDQDGTGGEVGQDELIWQFTTAAGDAPPMIQAWEPGGTSGQIPTQGDLVDVTWTASDDKTLPPNPINLTYGSGAVWNPIAFDEANDGLYVWDTSAVPCPNTYWINASVYDSAGQTTFDESNFSFTLQCVPDSPPTVQAWEPGGSTSQSFNQGDPVDVTWTASDDNPLPLNPINITYGAGAVWNPISFDEANDGIYVWDTSAVPCPGTYWMNISVYDSIGQIVFDESNYSFTIWCTGDSPPTVNAYEPGATSAQAHLQGDFIDITWSASDDNPLPLNPINITYGSGASWTPIANDEANDNLYVWDTSAVPCPGTYWVNISIYDSAGQTTFDESNYSFDINCPPDNPPSIAAHEPGGTAGQTYTQGDPIDVTWAASDDNALPPNPINITYGSGASWTSIANDEANDNLYVWDTSSVPCPGTYWMNISVYDSMGQTTFDESNFSFILNCVDNPPLIQVLSPGDTSGQTYVRGDTIQVSWTASDDNLLPANPIGVAYGSPGSWTTLSASEPNDSTYSWDTSGVVCPGTYWMNLTVQDSIGQTSFDLSDFSFDINCPATGDVYGKVVDENGDPLENVNLTIEDSGGSIVGNAVTDANGDFTFSGIDEGTGYTVNAGKAGYKPGTVGGVAVAGGSSASAGTITLDANATISGTVISDSGVAVVDAIVTLLDENGNVIETTTTDSLGEYTFTGLGYGDCTIEVTKQGYVDYSQALIVDGTNLSITHDVELTVEQQPEPDGGQDWTWLILLIVIIVIVVLILLIFLLKRRKREPVEAVLPVYMAGTKTEDQPVESAAESEDATAAAASTCKNCGAVLEPEYVLCPQCGTKR